MSINRFNNEGAAQPSQYIPGDVGFPPGAIRQGFSATDTEQHRQEQAQLDKARIDSLPKGFGVDGFRNEMVYTADRGMPKQPVLGSGSKYDGDKPRMDLLDADFLEQVASVLTFGAQKYAAHNWRGGIAYSRLIAAAYRHLGAINRGEDIDPESGLPHVAHLGCCVMFLSSMMAKKPELDDRFKGV